MSEDTTARERLAVVETSLEGHLIVCEQRAKDNTREHGEIRTLIVKVSDDLGKDIQRVFTRIWLLVGAALAASGSIIIAMYKSMEGVP